MNSRSISKKILHWYDNNKRDLPWRKHFSKIQKQYFILVSEFMLQQTQVKTVIPYFNNFVNKIPNLKKLANVNDSKLMKCWQGLGYYSRAKNLKLTAKKILTEHGGKIPNSIEDLKKLPGVGEYTSQAILAIAFNKPIVPLDGNVERVLKRVLYIKKNNKISKDYLNKKKKFFGKSYRASDFAQAIMEMGALVCKPAVPLCKACPLIKNCKAYKKKDFVLKAKNKVNKTKYFETNIYKHKNKYLLIKNKKFNFLKNLVIFPMKEINKDKFKLSLNKKINVKMSNMNMKIIINNNNKKKLIKDSFMIDKLNINRYALPSFTKKILNSISNFP